MIDCTLVEDGPGRWRCSACGWRTTIAGIRRNCPQWSPDQPSRGLGDTVAKITQATGIAGAVHAVSEALGFDCGCAQRQRRLNEAFPYREASG